MTTGAYLSVGLSLWILPGRGRLGRVFRMNIRRIEDDFRRSCEPLAEVAA